MHSSGGELAQLAMVSDSLSSHEFKHSAAACMLKQLLTGLLSVQMIMNPRPRVYS